MNLTLERLNPAVQKKIRPFLEAVLSRSRIYIHSIYVTGTALTEDFDPKGSDINSILVLKEMDLDLLRLIAPLGKKYSTRGIAAPFIMTPEFIERSLDIFPIEFLNFKLIHTTVFGDDLLKDVEIGRKDLREECERELKTRLIWLRRNFLSSMGDAKILLRDFVNTLSGYIPYFRAIITLLGKEPPIIQKEVIMELAAATDVNLDVFLTLLKYKRRETRPPINKVDAIFKDLYRSVENLGRIVDGIEV